MISISVPIILHIIMKKNHCFVCLLPALRYTRLCFRLPFPFYLSDDARFLVECLRVYVWVGGSALANSIMSEWDIAMCEGSDKDG